MRQGLGSTGVLALIISLLISCTKPHPEPEKLDPIYNDLVARGVAAKAAAEEKRDEINSIQSELKSLGPRDPTRRKTVENLRRAERQLMVAEQDALFYQIRSESRQAAARDEYRAAFKSGAAWPNPEDFERYKAALSLREGPREWSKRIPKTDRYNKKSDDEIKEQFEEKLKSKSGAN